MTPRDAILSALGDRSATARPPCMPAGKIEGELWVVFGAALETLGVDLLSPHGMTQFSGMRAAWDDAVPKRLTRDLVRAGVWEAEVGLSMADAAVAETGTLVLSVGPGRSRLGSLAPPHNIVVLRRSTLLATLDQAIAGLVGRTTVLVTGASRTADIESVLVKGIHGPRRLSVLPIDE